MHCLPHSCIRQAMPVLICLLLIMHFFLFKSQVHIAIQIPKAHGATILPPFWNDVPRTSQGLPSSVYIFASTSAQVRLNIEEVQFNGASLSETTRNPWRSFAALFFAWLLARCYSAEVGRYIEFSSPMIRFGLQFSRWFKAMSIAQLFPTCCGR